MAKKSNGRPASNRVPYDPYYPTDYKVGMKKKNPEVKPMYPTERVTSFKQWVGIFFVTMIPLINIIALIAWSRKKNTRVTPSVKNFSRAALMWTAIFYVIGIILGVVLAVL